MAPSLAELDLLITCGEGAGRSQHEKARASKWFPGKNLNAAGFSSPKSGRTVIPPEVIGVTWERAKVDISSWPIQKLDKELVTPSTIALILHPGEIPDYLPETALAILLAYLHDPATGNLENNLEIMATQLAFVDSLLERTLIYRLDEVIGNRDSNNRAIPRHLVDFEGQVEPEYSVKRFLQWDNGPANRVSSSDFFSPILPPDQYLPVSRNHY
jgi:hypothetical protein